MTKYYNSLKLQGKYYEPDEEERSELLEDLYKVVPFKIYYRSEQVSIDQIHWSMLIRYYTIFDQSKFKTSLDSLIYCRPWTTNILYTIYHYCDKPIPIWFYEKYYKGEGCDYYKDKLELGG